MPKALYRYRLQTVHLAEALKVYCRKIKSDGGFPMNGVRKQNEYQPTNTQQQVRSTVKGLLSGSLIILTVGILAYLLLFALMLLI